MNRFALILATTLVGCSAAQGASSPYPVNIEIQRGSILTIKHTPPARVVGARTLRAKIVRKHRVHRPTAVARKIHRRRVALYRDGALAGGCRDGGYVRVAVPPPGTVHSLHRDVCEGIAPIDSRPGAVRAWWWR
jgi:hypothetical protein